MKLILAAVFAFLSFAAFGQAIPTLPTSGAPVYMPETGQFSQSATFTTASDGPALIWASGYRQAVPYYYGYRNVVIFSTVSSVAVTDANGNPVCTPTEVAAIQPIEYKWTCSVADLPAGTYTVTMVGATLTSHGPEGSTNVVFSVMAQ